MGMYELLFVGMLIILTTYIWIAIGYEMKSFGDMVISIMPENKFETANDPINWSLYAFTIYLMFVSILVILWAMK